MLVSKILKLARRNIASGLITRNQVYLSTIRASKVRWTRNQLTLAQQSIPTNTKAKSPLTLNINFVSRAHSLSNNPSIAADNTNTILSTLLKSN